MADKSLGRELLDLVVAVSALGCVILGMYYGILKHEYARGTFYLVAAMFPEFRRLREAR